MQEQLATMQLTLDELDRGILSVDNIGTVRWATPRAERLLKRYGLQKNRRSNYLPSPLREWLKQQPAKIEAHEEIPSPLTPLVLEGPDRSLRIRFVPDGKHQLLFL